MKADPRRMEQLTETYRKTFSGSPAYYFSAPGRTEICGNHTDHQQGKVLAAAVNRDMLAAVGLNGTDEIRVLSEGYPMCRVRISELKPDRAECGTPISLIRGVAAQFESLPGTRLKGFNACITSQVLPGSGLSSSAAFEVLIGTILNRLFCGGSVPAVTAAKFAQKAENVYFGKPCGLMDQTASAVGNLVEMDFADSEHPEITPLSVDFSQSGYALCIIHCGLDHADLTEQYAAIPAECHAAAAFFGKEYLRQVPEEAFYASLPDLRKACGDRAVLRSMHFFGENRRVTLASQMLRENRFERFLEVLKESGRSSWMYLQNVVSNGDGRNQAMAVTLALCDHLLEGTGAFRVHGGGFAGTAQAFVPLDRAEYFCGRMDAALGAGACQILSIRPEGGTELEAAL